MRAADDLQQTVNQVETASNHFVGGDAVPFKACWSHSDWDRISLPDFFR